MLDNGHWQNEDFKQRMTATEWRRILLDGTDRLIFKGEIRQLETKRIGPCVYEVGKKPL